MKTLRASYSISPEVLQRFNAIVPFSQRSRTIQLQMERVLYANEQAKSVEQEAVALEFSSHPDFAQAREDTMLWNAAAVQV